MNRRTKLPALWLTIFFTHLSLSQATETTAPTYTIEPFMVVAPNLQTVEEALFRDSLSSAKPVDLAAILSARLPAAALTRKGPLAGDIVLRGFSRDNLQITVDDNKTFCACPNRMDPPAFHLSSQQIEAVSVRTGPFTVDQGGSIGGSIGVRTSAPSEESFTRLYGYFGSFDYAAAGITAGSPLGSSLTSLGGLYYQTGGIYEDGSGLPFTEIPSAGYLNPESIDTAFEVLTAEAKAAYTFNKSSTLTINYAFQDARDVLYPGLLMDAPTDTMQRLSLALRLPLAIRYADSLELSLAVSDVDHDMQDALRQTRNNMGGAFSSRGYFMRTQATSTFAGARLELGKEFTPQTHLSYGLDLSRRHWNANNIIGQQTNNMLPDTLNDKVGLWSVYEQRKGKWAFETGLRLDLAQSEAREDISFLHNLHNTHTNKRNDFLPSLYTLAKRTISSSFSTYAGLGYASRMPDPQERYMNLNRPMANPDWIGNPDLDPVRTLEAQGGLEWIKGDARLRLTAFHAWLFDYIYLAQLNVAPGGATSYANIDARLFGASFDASWQLHSSIRLEAGVAWQEGHKQSRPQLATNDVLAEIPPLKARLAAIYTRNAFSAQAEAQLQANLHRIDPDLGENTLDGWAILNLTTSYQINSAFNLSAGVDNVFDQTYAVANAFVRDPFRSGLVLNEPGRFWFIRAGVNF